MIQIDIVDYDNLSSLGMRITKYVNSNLRDIVRVLIDILETDPEFDLDGFFPRDYLMRKPQECRNAVNELELNHICLFDYLFISSQMSAKPYFIGSTGILLLW